MDMASLSALRLPLMTPVECGTQWISVVNPKAGGFQAPLVYDQVSAQVGDGMSRYETNPDPELRIRELSRLIAERRPSPRNPIGILAMGGDRTINDALLGILHYLFPNLKDLVERPEDRVMDQMYESGIQLGAVCLGGANDIGANYGSPRNKVPDIMRYLDEAQLMCLNLGAAYLYNDATPHIFCHSVSAGPTLAASFEETKDERGMAAKWHRARIGMMNILKHRPVQAQWTDDGVSHEGPVLEVLAHATVKVAQYNGLPGTPQPGGLGVVVFPGDSWFRTMKLFGEVTSRGRSALGGDPSRLLPRERLKTLEGRNAHILLPVSGERTFYFFNEQRDPISVPVGPNGDHLRRSQSLTIRALPPFPNFMVMEGSLMANLYRAIV